MPSGRASARARRRPGGRDVRRWLTRFARSSGPIIGWLVVSLGWPAVSGGIAAQTRELRHYEPGAPEAKLMLYYSSTVAFSPIGVPYGAGRASTLETDRGRSDPRLEMAVEVSYLPPLSAAQRTTGSDKPESTNLARVFARPRLAVRLPAGFGLEASWIPPVRVFDVTANLFAGALSRSFTTAFNVRIVPRVAFLGGRVEGPITCNRDTATEGGADLATYYSFVCYGNDSRDFFEPRHVSGELLVARPFANGRFEPYVSAGARHERTRFDIGVIRGDGSRDSDNPVLEVITTRAYGMAGASWLGVRRTRLAGEVYYAPGSALTVRALIGLRAW